MGDEAKDASIWDLATELSLARQHAREVSAKFSENLSAANVAVKKAAKALSDAISKGAKPCPGCGKPPLGMFQPKGKDAVEFEIGCPSCKPAKHSDGTLRQHSVRGGLMPRHAVEAWNAGPDFWQKASEKDAKVSE